MMEHGQKKKHIVCHRHVKIPNDRTQFNVERNLKNPRIKNVAKRMTDGAAFNDHGALTRCTCRDQET